jgi:hypothetical protein
MVQRHFVRLILTASVLLAAAAPASAACINRFVNRTERPHQVITLLTGKLTFQEAQALAAAIKAKEAPALEWIDEGGKTIARQFGDLKVVRPMPVGCDGKSSGVVLIVAFPTNNTPVKKIIVKLNPESTVTFDQQAD